jgi:hypothetical protein
MGTFWNYKQYKTMAQTADEEVGATSAGMSHAAAVQEELERQCCCKLGVMAASPTPRLNDIIANLFR